MAKIGAIRPGALKERRSYVSYLDESGWIDLVYRSHSISDGSVETDWGKFENDIAVALIQREHPLRPEPDKMTKVYE